MTTAHYSPSSEATQTTRILVVAFALFGAMICSATAQTQQSTTEAKLTLPDSPGSVVTNSSNSSSSDSAEADASFDPTTKTPRTTLPRVKFVGAGSIAPPQHASDKVILGLRESVTPFSIIGWFASAGFAQATNGSPNYGTDGKAFGQRLGAAAALSSSREIFSDSVLAPILHQDPRYYQLGRGQPFFKRLLYAGTRPIIGRTDGGHTIPNFAFIGGTAGAAALTRAYYPPLNRDGNQVFQTFGTSLGGSAIGYLISEFGGDVTQLLHISKHE